MFSRFKNNELIKNSAYLIGSNGLAQLITLLMYPFIARLFAPGEFGQLAVIVSIHSLLTTAASARYEQAIVLPEDDSRATDLFRIGWRIAVAVSLLIAPIVYLIGKAGFFPAESSLTRWFYLLGIMVLPAAVQQLGSGWCIRFRMFTVIAGATLVMSVSNALMKLGSGLLQIEDGLIYSFVAAQVITALFLVARIKKYRKIPRGTSGMMETARMYMNFPRYNLPTALLNNFSGNLPVYMLALYFTEDITGQFSVALALIFRPISTYNGSVYQVLMQKIVELQHTGLPTWPIIRKYILQTLMVAAVPAVILVLLIPYLIEFYIGPNWEEAGIFSRLLIPYAAVSLLCGPLAFIPNMFNKQFNSLIIDIIYLLMRFGALAAGIVLKNVYLAVGLYALAGIVVFIYQIIWYRRLLIESDRNRVNRS